MKTETAYTPPRRAAAALAPAALALILLATAAPFFLRNFQWAADTYRWVYAAGAAMLLAARIFDGRRTAHFRLKRLYRTEVWEGIIFCVAAAFLFYPGAEMRDWMAFTIAGAALQAYTSFAIPAMQSKLMNDGKKNS